MDPPEIFAHKLKEALKGEFDHITFETSLKELNGFSSVHALLIYSFVCQEYNVELPVKEFIKIQTVKELWEKVKKLQELRK